MTRYSKSKYSDRATLPEQMALKWHKLHRRDATHPRICDPDDWRNCLPCGVLNPYHRAARLAAARDIAARILDSMASTNFTQKERPTRPRSNWKGRTAVLSDE